MSRSEEFRDRLIDLTISVLNLVRKLPKNAPNEIFLRQILRSASSIGANYSEAIFAHSRVEFIHCLNISRKEANETIYWLQVLIRANPELENEINLLISEASAILKILISSIKTAKLNSNGK